MIMLFIFPHVCIAKFGVFVNDQLTQKLPLIPRTLITRGSIKNNQEWFVVSKFFLVEFEKSFLSKRKICQMITLTEENFGADSIFEII